jgi:hypothetical protein
MLEFLLGRASERQVRLLAVACCRRLTGLLWNPDPDNAIRVAQALMAQSLFSLL